VNHSNQDFLNAALRSNFVAFVHRCFLTLNAGVPFISNWHIEAIAYELQKILAGQITRLIINGPPRSLKSIIESVAFVAFVLGHQPWRRIFCISYGGELSSKHAADFRSIVTSDWYRRAFPKMRISRNLENEVITSEGGFRKATWVYGTLTGLGGDIFIIDDPLKAVDAQSNSLRNHLNDWFSSTLSSRLDNKATGIIVVVMQRVHLHDLTGHLLERLGDWAHLSLPAIAESDEEITIGDGKVYRRRAGEALHPEREPLSVLENLRRELGPDVFSAQYQQSPVPPGGAMIRREWLHYYDELPKLPYYARTIQSWDTAAKDGAQNDWSVCTTWKVADDCYYLIDLARGRYLYPALRDTAIALAKRYQPQWVLIEDACTGTSLSQELSLIYFGGITQLVPIERDRANARSRHRNAS
jgi:hypothetical protein